MHQYRVMNVATLLLWCLVPGQLSVVSAEPYHPTDDRHVLERLTVKATDPVARELAALRTDLQRHPRNLESAVKLAARYIEQGRSEGDPRFLGQAQAVLAPWWDDPAAPPAILILRATIKQNAHEFGPALLDLDRALTAQPTNIQAWLTKASILQVQARYPEARRACQLLTRLAARHIALACLTDIEGLTGHVTQNRRLLRTILDQSNVPDRERIWIFTILGELAARVGDTQEAERSYREAIAVGIKDQYLLGAYADFLLDQDRYQEVVRVLTPETKTDGLLLRLALAEQALHLPASKDHLAELAARFTASRDRGTRVHLREEARFTLALQHDPNTALALAQANWTVQKEPWDARLLLESALAAGNPRAARPVIEWLTSNQIPDLRLRALAQQVQGGSF